MTSAATHGLYRFTSVSLGLWVLFFLALSCLTAATVGSVVVYQRAEQRRLRPGAGAPRRQLGPHPDEADADEVPLRDSRSEARRARPTDGQQSRAHKTARTAPEDEPTLQTLAPGDVVLDGDDDWLVVGSVDYREESDAWALHLLEGGTRQRLLEVRARRTEVEVAFLDPVSDLPRGQLLDGLTFRGHGFRLEGRGDARTGVRGDAGDALSRGGTLEWSRYGAAGGGLLLVEDEGAARRGFLGQRVLTSSLSVMSGALNRADDDS